MFRPGPYVRLRLHGGCGAVRMFLLSQKLLRDSLKWVMGSWSAFPEVASVRNGTAQTFQSGTSSVEGKETVKQTSDPLSHGRV